MAEKVPKIRAYSLVKKEYGSGMSLAIDDGSGMTQIIGDITRPRTEDVKGCPLSSGPSSRAAEEARAKKRAEEDKAFAGMVLKHLNDGLAMETGRKRLERTKD